MKKLITLCTILISVSGCGSTGTQSVPVANPGGPYVGTVGMPLVVDGSASRGGDLSYFWSFGDGTPMETGETALHFYNSPGSYSVCLEVSADGAYSEMACTSAYIFDDTTANFPPIANAGPDQTVDLGDAVILDGSSSFDIDGKIVRYAWDFGDGTAGEGVAVTHTYRDFGSYTATLTVTDDRDAWTSDTAQVTVVDEDAELVIKKMEVKDAEPGEDYRISAKVKNIGTVPVVNALFRATVQDSCQGHHMDWGLEDKHVSFNVGEEKHVKWEGKVPADAALGEYRATIDIYYAGKVLSTSASFTVSSDDSDDD